MIRTEPWSDAAEIQLSRCVGAAIMPHIRAEVARGQCQLWHATDEEGADAYIVTRIEGAPLEWCFVACAGVGVMRYARLFVEEGKRRGLSMRCHVIDSARARLWGRVGFKVSEYVLRVA